MREEKGINRRTILKTGLVAAAGTTTLGISTAQTQAKTVPSRMTTSLSETEVIWEKFKTAEKQWADPEPMVLLHSEDFDLNNGAVKGREGLRSFEISFREGFPDWQREYLDVAVGDGIIAFRWHAAGTHLGPFFGNSATGRRIDTTGASFMYVENGLITKSFSSPFDDSVFLRQLGLPVNQE